MSYDEGAEVICPTCFQVQWIPIDPSGGARQDFVVDCQICCRPMDVAARVDAGGEISAEARSPDEAG